MGLETSLLPSEKKTSKTRPNYQLKKSISYTVGFVGRKMPQIGLSYTVEKGLFWLNFFRLSFPTGVFSRKSQFFRLDPPAVEKLSRKSFTYTCFYSPSHQSSHHQTHTHMPTHPHVHTPTPGTTQHSIIQGADAGLSIAAVASRRKSSWRIPSSARQQRVAHDGSSARYRPHFANNGYACCSFGGSRLSATSRTYVAFVYKPEATNSLGRRFERAKHRAANRFSTAIQQYSSAPSHRPPLGRAQKRKKRKKNRLDWR